MLLKKFFQSQENDFGPAFYPTNPHEYEEGRKRWESRSVQRNLTRADNREIWAITMPHHHAENTPDFMVDLLPEKIHNKEGGLG